MFKTRRVMKKLLLAIVIIAPAVFGVNMNAQGRYGADSAECVKYLSYYKEYFKQKDYESSIPAWRKAYELCPPASMQTMLVDGAVLVRRLISANGKNAEYQAALIDTLMTLHQQRAENFPKYAVTARNNMAIDISNFFKGNAERQFEEYEKIVEANQSKSKASVLLFDLAAAVELFKDGKIPADEVLKVYERNSQYFDGVIAADNTDEDKENNSKTRADFEGCFATSGVASCENLISLFGPKYEADPDNLDLATSIVRMMNIAEDCTNNSLYLNAATTMYRLNPSAAAAHALFKLNAAGGNVDDALRYAEEAISSPESDIATDASYSLELAVFCLSNKMSAKAYEAAQFAATNDASLAGKAYMIIANVWASATCGDNEIEKRAPYWVAVDYLIKAKAADESLTEEANRLIAQYSKYYPQTADAFMYDVTDGNSYTVSCSGMRATTTVRTQK